jgi:hypothetical protein
MLGVVRAIPARMAQRSPFFLRLNFVGSLFLSFFVCRFIFFNRGKKKAPLVAGLDLCRLNFMPASSHLPPNGWNKIEVIEVKVVGVRHLS